MELLSSYFSDDSCDESPSDLANENLHTAVKHDFFNLDGNDSDEQNHEDNQIKEKTIDNVENSIDSILASASVLNDRSYGPEASQIQIYNNFPENNSCKRKADEDSSNSSKSQKYETFFNYKVHKTYPKATTSGEKSRSKPNQTVDPPVASEKILFRTENPLHPPKACSMPKGIAKMYKAHEKLINALQWCIPQFSHLMLTASADGRVKIWDTLCKNPVRIIENETGVKGANWTLDGRNIIVGDYYTKAVSYDVCTGKPITKFFTKNNITCLQVHPSEISIFMVGTKNKILCFDARRNREPIRTYTKHCQDILDIAFIDDNTFVCSTGIVSHDSADKTIIAWDFQSTAILSNQIYLERYTCPALKVHPSGNSFVAQTSGDYIAAFGSRRPYKIKNKRYVGHKVGGYSINCDISPDGVYLISGDSAGSVFVYNYNHAELMYKTTINRGVPLNRVQWHPVLPRTIATATWDGSVQILK